MVTVALRSVANKLEPANHLADGEEPKNLSSDHTDSVPLLARDVSYLLKYVGGRLLGSAVCLAGNAVHEGAGVTEEIQGRLDVALHGLD